jgi:hypothetical protein
MVPPSGAAARAARGRVYVADEPAAGAAKAALPPMAVSSSASRAPVLRSMHAVVTHDLWSVGGMAVSNGVFSLDDGRQRVAVAASPKRGLLWNPRDQ